MKYKMGKPLAALMTASILFSSGASIYAESEEVSVASHAAENVAATSEEKSEENAAPKEESAEAAGTGEEKSAEGSVGEETTGKTEGSEKAGSSDEESETPETGKNEAEIPEGEDTSGSTEGSDVTEGTDETKDSGKKEEKEKKTAKTGEETETKESEEPETTPVDNSTALPDGDYRPDSFTFSGGSGKVSISCSKVTVADGKAFAVIRFSSEKYTELKANGTKYEGKCGNGVSEYTVPIQLDIDNTVIGKTTAMSKVNWITYTIHASASEAGRITDTPVSPTPTPVPDMDYEDGDYSIGIESGYKMFKIASSSAKVENGKILVTIVTGSTSYDKIYLGSKDDETKEPVIQGVLTEDGSGYVMTFELDRTLMGQTVNFVPGKADGSWYEKKQYTLTIPAAMDKIEDKKDDPKDDDKKDDQKEDDKKDDDKNDPSEIRDGDYTIDVTTSTGVMFKVVSAVLTNKNGVMTAKITLSGTGYDYLYIGTVGDAPGQKKNWVKYTLNGSGQYVFEIPVEALDKEIKLAAHSAKNDAWYERGIIFESSTMKAVNVSDPSGKPDTTPAVTPKPTQKPANDKKPETESKYESDLSGGTSAVDSSTGLADGVYTPDKFSWSGGSGRTSISCSKVTVTGGQAYATIVFSSSTYGYVKANGNVYYPSYGGGTSTFTIPVKLNANNTIIGMTTAMSAAHEITYSIFVYIAGADKTGADSSELSKNDELSEKAPEIAGLDYVNEEKVEHAKYFKIYHYDQDISLIEIDLGTDTDRPEDLETGSEETSAEETGTEETAADAEEGSAEEAKDTTTIISDLYKNKVIKYLIVPEDAEIPVGLEKEVIVVNVPVESIYTDSGEAEAFLKKLDKTDLITLEGEKGTKPEYKDMILKKTDLAVLTDEFLWDKEKDMSLEEQTELFYEITERLTTLDVPVLIDRSADEASEEASEEWIKVYEEIFD